MKLYNLDDQIQTSSLYYHLFFWNTKDIRNCFYKKKCVCVLACLCLSSRIGVLKAEGQRGERANGQRLDNLTIGREGRGREGEGGKEGGRSRLFKVHVAVLVKKKNLWEKLKEAKGRKKKTQTNDQAGRSSTTQERKATPHHRRTRQQHRPNGERVWGRSSNTEKEAKETTLLFTLYILQLYNCTIVQLYNCLQFSQFFQLLQLLQFLQLYNSKHLHFFIFYILHIFNILWPFWTFLSIFYIFTILNICNMFLTY